MVSGKRRKGAFFFAGFAALGALLGTSACSSSSDGGSGGYCDTWIGRLRECGAVGSGRVTCVDYKDHAELCETACMQKATCADIVLGFCGGGATTNLTACISTCSGQAVVTCGDGSKLPGYDRCDGNTQCADGADEAGCTSTGLKCRNVDEYVDPAKRCDGTKDCSDGSDETPDCPPALNCEVAGVATDLSIYELCNGQPECDDGSDEAKDCAVHMCGLTQN